MNTLDIYTFNDIIGNCDIDTSLMLMRISKYLYQYCNNISFECFLKTIKMKILLQSDANTLLHFGIQFSSLRFVKYAIKCGITVNCNQMCNACYIGNTDIVDYCIQYGSARPHEGMFCACFRGHLDVIRILCAHDVKSIEIGLIYACALNQKDIVKYLLKYYNVRLFRDTSIKSESHENVAYPLQKGFDIAYQQKNIDILEILIKQPLINTRQNYRKIKHLQRKIHQV